MSPTVASAWPFTPCSIMVSHHVWPTVRPNAPRNKTRPRFWTMHDLLFERQDQIWRAGPELMISWATELGLNGDALATCLADPAIAAKIEQLDQARQQTGIRLRPSFDLNGRLIQGALPYPQLAAAFDDLLNQ